MESRLNLEVVYLPAGGFAVRPSVFDPNSESFIEEEKLHACRTDVREVSRFLDGVLASWASEVDEVRRQQSIDDATNVTRLEHHRPTLFQRMFG